MSVTWWILIAFVPFALYGLIMVVLGIVASVGWPELHSDEHNERVATLRQHRDHYARTKTRQLENELDAGAATIAAELNRMRARSDAARKSWNERGAEASELFKGMYDDGRP